MKCPACEHENRAGRRFCGECGAPLAPACAACGSENELGEKFCGDCGASLAQVEVESVAPVRDPRAYTPKHLADKILQSKSALEGERKQVTVLFADVQGSTEIASQLDPEEWHVILDRFFQILTDGVHRFEGTVNQYTGDGIMALFGAPIAHEDHAQRACYAALHLRDDLRRYADEIGRERGLNLSTRMGLNSGEVVVGRIGDDLRMDYTAQGQVVHLAQRMEQVAGAGHVYLTDDTATRVSGFFRLRDVGPIRIKGLREPVHVHDLEDVGAFQSGFDVSRARGLSGFVGREHEMATLEAALEQARKGLAPIVGIVAEAGTGKSRLTHEFTERCRSQGILVAVGSCPPHGRSVPLGVVMAMQRSGYGITERDSAEQAREKIAAMFSLWGPQVAEFLPFAMEFLGVAEPGQATRFADPDARQRELVRFTAAVGDQSLAKGILGVNVCEDMHWIDAASQSAFLELNRLRRRASSWLTVFNYRPEYRPPEADWPNYEEIRLKPLTAESIDALLRDLLGPEATGRGLEPRIGERVAGNPFFVEEIVQSLAESSCLEGQRGAYRLARPMEAIDVPDTVQTVLAARIDRLDERAKRTLQAAAVIGKEFPVPLLQDVVAVPARDIEAALHDLAHSDFIYQEAAYPELEYAFKHPLTQQVAYETQLRDRRCHLHGEVARHLERRYADKLDEKAALIAHHWEQAREPLEASRWHGRAAKWARTRDPASAIRHWRKVKELSEALATSPETSALRLSANVRMIDAGIRLGLTEEEASVLFAESRRIASENRDARSLAMLLSSYSQFRAGIGDQDAALNLGEEAVRVAAETDHVRLKLLVQTQLAFLLFVCNRHREALSAAERGLELGRSVPKLAPEGGFGASIFLEMVKGFALAFVGRLEESRGILDRAAEIARKHSDLENLGFARSWAVYPLTFLGDAAGAIEYARQGVEIAERLGSALSLGVAYNSLGLAHSLSEHWGEAVTALTRALAISRQSQTFLYIEAGLLAELADAYLGQGDLDRARELSDEAVALASARPLESVRLTRARVLRRCQGAQARLAIETDLHEALSTLRQTGRSTYEPYVHLELAELSRLTGDRTTCERELREAHRLFTEMGATRHAERVAKELR